MAAFKAANPGSVLEDFVRWHSPNDWIVDAGADSGRLSTRMADTANTWHTLWEVRVGEGLSAGLERLALTRGGSAGCLPEYAPGVRRRAGAALPH